MIRAMITRERCKEESACYTDAELEAFIPTEGISPLELVALIGETRSGCTLTAADCHLALCCGVPEPERFAKQYRLHAVWCARRALARVESPDPRSVEAVDVAERFANGLATKEELTVAREAAMDAAWDADSVAASDAARAAAWDAASVAARYAAWDAAWDAECLEQCKDLADRLEVS